MCSTAVLTSPSNSQHFVFRFPSPNTAHRIGFKNLMAHKKVDEPALVEQATVDVQEKYPIKKESSPAFSSS
jgi:hypothetical protein